MELDIEAGAYEGKLDLSGIPLLRLDINGGAGDTEVRFDTPNPQQMSVLNFETGASDVELNGLGNANFAEMNFTGAAGNYTLDFSGELQRDATVDINGAVGDLTIIVPEGRQARITVSSGLSDIETQGNWQVTDNVYASDGTGPLLQIAVEMNIGQLELINQ